MERLLKIFGRSFVDSIKDMLDIRAYAEEYAEELGVILAALFWSFIQITAIALPIVAIVIILM